ncbi:hypothetical protein MTR_1g069875 [Medicago truncatula]|uniref:Uncharacterized protein n=1 Tax=Medicago truncatula TaxID=3880 RepID=A0A072VLM1_MEDTR|nr:hypothetical protein MTR_1g069875 [Medicago truncatula]
MGAMYLHARSSETFNVLPHSFFLVLDDIIQGRHGLQPLSSRGEYKEPPIHHDHHHQCNHQREKQSVALSDGYIDGEDHGDSVVFFYNLSGGRDLIGDEHTNKNSPLSTI